MQSEKTGHRTITNLAQNSFYMILIVYLFTVIDKD